MKIDPTKEVKTMKRILAMLAFCSLALFGCECPDAPDSYKGASLSGCSWGDYVSCCSYDGYSCSYTLCQEDCHDWHEVSWYCW